MIAKTILISEPNALDAVLPHLPYMWAILKSHWERHGSVPEAYRWLDPVFRCAHASEVLQPYGEAQIDVLGLSCYTWNWTLQCEIAQAVKSRNPGCLVVAGGPEPDYQDPAFFRTYPFIDVVVVKDGEITFARILDKLLQGSGDFSDIGGLYLPMGESKTPVSTGNAEVPKIFDYSPYIDQSAYYERLMQETRLEFAATWETNRGCPYSCSYCDWGSSTMSKVRQFDMNRVRAELDWFGRMKVFMLFQADANFGILPRDIEIASLLNTIHAQYGIPKQIVISYAKNNPDRVMQIAELLSASGVNPVHQLAIQHTNREVLAATERANISVEKQIAVVKHLMAHDVPINVQLILGIPGDTYERWKGCFADLMEWGIHSHYWFFHYLLLPNAPAAAPDYRARWQIETIERYTFNVITQKHDSTPPDPVLKSKQKTLVATKSFSREDWVRMNVYASFVVALHNCSVTQLIAKYLRFTHDLSYLDFYTDLIDVFCTSATPVNEYYEAVRSHYQAFLDNEDAVDAMIIRHYPDFELNPSRWVFVEICQHFDDFFAALKSYLVARYPSASNLTSLIDYQKNLVILPSYDCTAGKMFATDLDWIGYFQEIGRSVTVTPLGEPGPAPKPMVRVSDTTCGDRGGMHPLDWGTKTGAERWVRWLEHTVAMRNTERRNNFQQLQYTHRPARKLLPESWRRTLRSYARNIRRRVATVVPAS